ncbi:hypothetical protein Pse7367_3784 (plasmid) [Thalassoporum mexicanum PCC 7367]|nr:hypothetical protein Pse7367_3784 [Pseudanabaena sp. PCC 7367]
MREQRYNLLLLLGGRLANLLLFFALGIVAAFLLSSVCGAFHLVAGVMPWIWEVTWRIMIVIVCCLGIGAVWQSI